MRSVQPDTLDPDISKIQSTSIIPNAAKFTGNLCLACRFGTYPQA